MDILFSVEKTSATGMGIQWSDEVKMRVASYHRLKDKKAAMNKLAQLKEKLHTLQAQFENLRKKNNFFARMDMENVQKDIQKVKAEIAQIEKVLNT